MRVTSDHRGRRALLIVAALAVAGSGTAWAASRVARPEEVRVEEHLEARLPLDAVFRDSDGRAIRLGDLFTDEKPVILVLAYERCPLLCGLVHSSTVQTIKQLDWKLGQQFRAVTVSFDPSETPEASHRKQSTLLADLDCAAQPSAWPFLTGSEASIESLTDCVGFLHYKDPKTGEFAHPAVITVLTPQGKVSRYLYGVEYSPRDLKLALLEASEGRSGTTLEKIELRCYRYDPATHRYQLAIANTVRVFGLVTLAVVGLLVGTLWRRERRRVAAA